MLAVFPPLIMLSITSLAIRMRKLHPRPFLNPNWLSDVTKKHTECTQNFKCLALADPEIEGVPKFKSRPPGKGGSRRWVFSRRRSVWVDLTEASKEEKWLQPAEPEVLIMHYHRQTDRHHNRIEYCLLRLFRRAEA